MLMRRTRIMSFILVALFVSSVFTIGLGSMSIDNNALSTVEEMTVAAIPTGLGRHIPSMPSILVYTEFADLEPDPGYNEFTNTIASIEDTYGSKFYYENLTDYTKLGSRIGNFDILLIVEQEDGYVDNMTMVGEAWGSTLLNFVNDGGIVILMDYGISGPGGLGGTSHIYNSSGLVEITGF
ncbi:MAG: hypothetical protein EAX95_14075, partial [Candidatus Thorarchaeota archaeon]|nr:hypothetical protein [Candidatus Thorarchaeota archaeon]